MKNKFIFGSFLLTSSIILTIIGFNSASASSCDVSKLKSAYVGQKGAHVILLQDCLIERGYGISSDKSGYFGRGTQKAVKSFYREQLSLGDWNGRSFGLQAIKFLRGKKASSVSVSVPVPVPVEEVKTQIKGLKKISSTEELKKYLKNSSGSYFGSGVRMLKTTSMSEGLSVAQSVASSAPERVSTTNVQVLGIDEPDIVKTDGTTIYFSRERSYDINPIRIEKKCKPNGECVSVDQSSIPRQGVTAITTFPLESLGIASNSIPEQGEMLLVKDQKILVIMATNKIVAYDISDPAKPVKKWTNDFKDNTSLITARLKDNKIYLVTSTYPNIKSPCPIIPMTRGDVSISIPCSNIWAPISKELVNTIYTILVIDSATGVEKNTLTYLGDTSNTTISVFGDNLYLAYRMQSIQEKVTLDFFKTDLKDLLSSSLQARIEELSGYNISNQSKLTEIMNEIEKESNSESESSKLKIETEIQNRLTSYLDRRIRDINRTMVVQVALNTLTVEASNTIPGYLLNQFAMDEYNGNLRVAVTVGDQWNSEKSKNDVYVLDSKLAIVGSVIDLGLTERIYSARFIGDRGYLVTFRQIDPFYVLDLSVPSSPKMVGELKIPGYSAYLEPISDNIVLGVGREDRKVKMSLFDVSDPKNPIEKSKYLLDESWTEVESNHRAFLRDPKYKVFFIPGGKGGYVISYTDDKLSLTATVAVPQVKRALFIEDNLYIVAENKITVLDEKTWKEVKELKF